MYRQSVVRLRDERPYDVCERHARFCVDALTTERDRMTIDTGMNKCCSIRRHAEGDRGK